MNDYFKYLTTVFIEYLEQPKDLKKQKREEKKAGKQPVTIRLFGLIPFAITHHVKKINEVIHKRDRR